MKVSKGAIAGSARWAAAAALLALAIAACNGESSPSARPESPAVQEAAPTATPSHPGQQNYVTHCAACHGVNGEGQPNWIIPGPDGLLPAPPHDNTGHTWHHGDGYLFQVTKRGGLAFAMPGRPSAMPGFDTQMTDREIVDVLEYIKRFWGRGEREFQATASMGDPYPPGLR